MATPPDISPRYFRDWSVSRKLLAIVITTTAVASLLAGAGILVSDAYFYQRSLGRDLSALAGIIADNSTAALAFDDSRTANETLSALRARTHLVVACIYKRDGSVLASYSRQNNAAPCPPAYDQERVQFLAKEVAVSRPVLLANRPIGSLTLLYDLGEITERRTLFGATVLLIMMIASAVAAALSARLRRLIVAPISQLVGTVGQVSSSRDYSIRAEKVSGDELGVLVDAFNEMLHSIQSRDRELKEALSTREQVNRRLARSNEDLERFAFVASHDLQEPLRMITVYTQLLQKRAMLESSAQSDEFVANIVNGTRRMRELLADLLAYAEIGAQTDPTAKVDLNAVLVKVKENLRYAIETNGARITSVPLPTLNAYEGHFIPLLQNLISNAIKYRDQDAPDILLGFEREGSTLRFWVKDNGIGISPEYHTKIFAAFKRLHGQSIPGTGIGLAICHRVVERYGGRIWVDSRPGQGSTFSFTLPDTLLAAAPERQAEEPPRGRSHVT